MIELSRIEIAGYQILEMVAVPRDRHLHPSEIATLALPADLDLTREVILFGNMPIWVYGALIDLCRDAAWIGCYAALAGGAVVIHSRVPQVQPGDTIAIAQNPAPCPAIVIGGPPNSGKSVLSKALLNSLRMAWSGDRATARQIYLHRANWDGEGNWAHETQDRALIQRLIIENERRIHEHPDSAQHLQPYFEFHAQATTHLRTLVNVVLVDVGGKTQPEKLPLMQQCTHAIVISRDPDLVKPWLDFCLPALKPLAVIHSVRENRVDVLQTTPWLELVAGPWNQGETHTVPDVLLHYILQNLDA